MESAANVGDAKQPDGNKPAGTMADLGNDPHDLMERFIRTHARKYDDALSEIRAGGKRSCWSWFILPTPPWIVRGVERGSGTNRYYALRTDEQAAAYLTCPAIQGVNLRQNYIEICNAIGDRLQQGQSLRSLLGFLDEPKFKSSVHYFHRMAVQMKDEELTRVCARVIQLIQQPANSDDDSDSSDSSSSRSDSPASAAPSKGPSPPQETPSSSSNAEL